MDKNKLKKHVFYSLQLSRKHITFKFDKSVSENNRNLVIEYLNEPHGWVSKGYTFEEVSDNKKKPLVILYFKTSYEMKQKYKGFANLSVTDFATIPLTISFNKTNWDKPPLEFIIINKEKDTRLIRYRKYLVQHEFGHVLGFDHPELPKKYSKCNVMIQQSKYTEPYCQANYSQL